MLGGSYQMRDANDRRPNEAQPGARITQQTSLYPDSETQQRDRTYGAAVTMTPMDPAGSLHESFEVIGTFTLHMVEKDRTEDP